MQLSFNEENKIITTQPAKNLTTLLSLVRIKNSNFENISFKGFQGEGLRLASVVDSTFTNITFQYGFGEGALTFGKELIRSTAGASQNVADPTENLYFDNIIFKNIIGSCILFETGSDVSSSSFNSLLIDGGNASYTEDGTQTP